LLCQQKGRLDSVKWAIKARKNIPPLPPLPKQTKPHACFFGESNGSQTKISTFFYPSKERKQEVGDN